METLTKGQADWHTTINSNFDEINSNFEELETANTDRGQHTELCEWGTYASGSITLTDSISNYKYIVIHAGSATDNDRGGGRTMEMIPTSLIELNDMMNIMYQLNGNINSITYQFADEKTLQILYTYSTGLFQSGIRIIYGIK